MISTTYATAISPKSHFQSQKCTYLERNPASIVNLRRQDQVYPDFKIGSYTDASPDPPRIIS
jgi:hypothetical protein